MTKRNVYVEYKKFGNSFCVVYAERNKGQHYWAAQFYASDMTLAKVCQWVKDNPRFNLVETPEGLTKDKPQ